MKNYPLLLALAGTVACDGSPHEQTSVPVGDPNFLKAKALYEEVLSKYSGETVAAIHELTVPTSLWTTKGSSYSENAELKDGDLTIEASNMYLPNNGFGAYARVFNDQEDIQWTIDKGKDSTQFEYSSTVMDFRGKTDLKCSNDACFHEMYRTQDSLEAIEKVEPEADPIIKALAARIDALKASHN